MQQLERILVPIDVNIDSIEQINTIIKLSDVFKPEIYLLYVVPDEEVSVKIREILIKSIKKSLNEVKEVLKSKEIRVLETEVIFGPIVKTIVQKATEVQARLILLGARKKRKGEHFKLGVIAGQIIREADVPVFLIHRERETFFSSILCPVDFSEPSKRALNIAILLSEKFNSTLKIIKVYEPLEYVSRWTNIDLDAENAERLRDIKEEMKEFLHAFDLRGVAHTVEIKSGKVDAKILNIIKRQRVDLLIMGTNGRTGLSRFFMGSVTEKVIREMPCSFITVRSF